ncbi:hypothetical protein [Roseibium sp. RKSG952]|uniref:hypothetical protein n=1 Tax=Roseibium sp. RKSG952 TaxID=2529384 RepID=UPI0012BD229F|nr:hypothetical protein [Roseibium sp. RKSG952]MTH96697.1 hypothetical protein [Roseibium sp. RKSG952]
MMIEDAPVAVKPASPAAEETQPASPAEETQKNEPEDEDDFAEGLAKLSEGVQARSTDETVVAPQPQSAPEASAVETPNVGGETSGSESDSGEAKEKKDLDDEPDLKAEAANDDLQKAAMAAAAQARQNQERQQHHGGYGSGGVFSAFLGNLGKRLAPNKGLSPTEAAMKKYFNTRERRIPNNLNALNHQADKLVGSIDAYNKSILGNDKLKALEGTAAMKGITLSEYVGQLQANPSGDPTGANILSDVLKDPSVRSKRSAMAAELEKAETLSDRINKDISELSSKAKFSPDPAKLQREMEFLAEREADIAKKIEKNAPDLVSKSKDDKEFEKRMKEIAENMRNMIIAVVNKIANAVGGGPKAG